LPQVLLARAFALFLLANAIQLWFRATAGQKTQKTAD
jgi:hypothetical protein